MIWSFVLKHLPAIILATLIGIIGYQFYSITSERDEALRDLNNLRHALDIAKSEHAGKLEALKAEGIRNQAKQKQQHIADIQHIGKQYGRELNDKQATINRYRSDITDSVRNLQALNDRLRESENDANRLTGNDSNATTFRPGEDSAQFYRSAYRGSQEYIETLEQAGAVCAADYNRCYAYVKSEQGRLGIESVPTQ